MIWVAIYAAGALVLCIGYFIGHAFGYNSGYDHGYDKRIEEERIHVKKTMNITKETPRW